MESYQKITPHNAAEINPPHPPPGSGPMPWPTFLGWVCLHQRDGFTWRPEGREPGHVTGPDMIMDYVMIWFRSHYPALTPVFGCSVSSRLRKRWRSVLPLRLGGRSPPVLALTSQTCEWRASVSSSLQGSLGCVLTLIFSALASLLTYLINQSQQKGDPLHFCPPMWCWMSDEVRYGSVKVLNALLWIWVVQCGDTVWEPRRANPHTHTLKFLLWWPFALQAPIFFFVHSRCSVCVSEGALHNCLS